MVSGTAAAQPGTAPPPEEAPAAAPAPAPAAPAPPTAPPTAPPGYMLVPIPPASSSQQTRYEVVYPQPRGALPPGMELPYEDGDPIPDGYRLVKRNRRGLIVAGSIVTGVPWTFSVMGAVAADFDNHSGFLLVPGIGPWLMLAAGAGKDDCGPDDDPFECNDKSGLRAVLVLDGIVQTAGAVMFVSGFAFPRKRLVRRDVTVGVAPGPMGREGYGLGLVGTF